MEANKVIQGTCIEVMATFPDKSIDCVITSPPYWQLRDYKWDGQWGLEPTLEMYLLHLWMFMEQCRRVLKDEGTVWVNLGDTYSGSNGSGWKQTVANDNQSTAGENINVSYRKITGRIDEAPSKCLLLVPHRFAIGCIDRGWIVRNDIIWAKRNGMPESVTDRFTKKHEYFFLIVKQGEYYFDLDGIRDRHAESTVKRYERGYEGNEDRDFVNGPQNHMRKFMNNNNAKEAILDMGKNPGDVSDFWDIPTQSNSDEHYAAYNDKLIGKPIVAGCPKDGIILDPFCGTATTGCRAIELGRKFIGIEGSEKYVKLANNNLKPYVQQQLLF